MAEEGDGPVYSWAAEYAKSGRSKCAITKEPIKQGALRIGKEVDNPFKVGTKMFIWHSVDALFASFRRGAASKPRITELKEVAGYEDLESNDQEKVEELIEDEAEFRAGLAEVDDEATRLQHTKNGGVFWSIVQAEHTTRVRWGAIGGEESVSEKEHKDEAAATKFVATKIKEKEKGGYTRK